MLEQTGNIADSFGPRDLILIDRNTSGSPFTMIAGPLSSLYHKNAVYFFNPEDLGKIDRTPYERVWLVVPTRQAVEWKRSLPGYDLRLDRNFTLESAALGSPLSERKTRLCFPGTAPFGNTVSVFEIE